MTPSNVAKDLIVAALCQQRDDPFRTRHYSLFVVINSPVRYQRHLAIVTEMGIADDLIG